MTKDEIRAEMRRRRKAVSAADRAAASHAVSEKLLTLLGSARLVCCYRALPTEIDPAEFVTRCGAEVVFPEKTADGYAVLRAAEVDLWICPGLAFTTDGRRIGFGGGWYDRFLAQKKRGARAFGIGYAFQIVADLPSEPHDVRLDGVIV